MDVAQAIRTRCSCRNYQDEPSSRRSCSRCWRPPDRPPPPRTSRTGGSSSSPTGKRRRNSPRRPTTRRSWRTPGRSSSPAPSATTSCVAARRSAPSTSPSHWNTCACRQQSLGLATCWIGSFYPGQGPADRGHPGECGDHRASGPGLPRRRPQRAPPRAPRPHRLLRKMAVLTPVSDFAKGS